MSDLNIAMILRLVDRVSGPSRKAMGAIREIGVTADRSGQAMINQSKRLQNQIGMQQQEIQRSVLGIGAMGGAMYGAMRPAIEFEKSMAGVAAVAKANDEQLAKMSATARQLGATTPWAASEAAEGMKFLAQAGFEVNDVIAAMPGMLNLASAGTIGLGDAADIASNILTGFKLEADEMGRVGDVMTNTFTSSNVNLQMIGETMAYVAPDAAAAGMSLEQAAAAAGLLGDAGIQGSRAGTALRSMLARLAAPTGKAATIIQDLGVKTQDANGNLRSLPDILADMNSAMANMGTAAQTEVRATVFGLEAASAAAVLLDQAGSGNFQKFSVALEEQGAAARVASEMNDTTAGSIKELMSKIEAIAITIGTVMLPAMNDLLDTIGPILEGFRAWAEANPELVETLAKLAGVLLGLKIGALLLRIGFVALASPLAKVLKFVGILLRIVGFANPFVLMIAGVVALATAIYENWDKIVAYFKDKIAIIRLAFADGFIQGIIAMMREFNPFTLLEDGLVGFIQWALQKIDDLISSILAAFGGLNLYEAGKAMIQSLWDGAKSLLGEMVASIKAKLAEMLPDWVATRLGIDDSAAPAIDRASTVLPEGMAAGSSPTTNTFNITQQPGESGEALAQRVVTEQARGSRRNRRTAALHDGGDYD